MPPSDPVSSPPEALGLIAGRGAYPLELAESARVAGVRRLFAVAFRGETERRIERLVDEVRWIHVGQLGAFLEHFRASGVTQAVMAGQIAPRNLFLVRFDAPLRALLARLPRRNADTIFGAIGEELAKIGITLRPASLFMESRLPVPGLLTRRAPDAQERADLALALSTARACAALQIGQTVVVKQGTILAVEAFEGTDPAIRRAGQLARGQAGSVVAKARRPGHDMRFDIPVVGLRTLDSLRKARCTALGLEAGGCILLEREAVIREADRLGLAIEVFPSEEKSSP
jgi:DUF1009 family protein